MRPRRHWLLEWADGEVCDECEVKSPDVRGYGREHCPNPLCTAPGAMWFYGVLPSLERKGDGIQIDTMEALAVAEAMTLPADVAEVRDVAAAEWRHRHAVAWQHPDEGEVPPEPPPAEEAQRLAQLATAAAAAALAAIDARTAALLAAELDDQVPELQVPARLRGAAAVAERVPAVVLLPCGVRPGEEE